MLLPAQGHAASPTASARGISISPFIQTLSIQPNDLEKSFSLKLSNNTSSIQELRLSAQDFGSLDETGGVLLEGGSSYTKKYGLTSWLQLGADTVVLQPKQSREIPVVIQNRSSLQPGGHYAAVVASVKQLDAPTGNEVAINQQLMSLLLVNKTGGEKYALNLTNIEQNGNWFKLPTVVKLRFQNPGNVHVVPRGTVELKSPGGTVIARGIINSESAFVLPETFREIYVPLEKVANDFPAPGLYRIDVKYRYDGIDKTAEKSEILRFINLQLWCGLAIIVIAVLLISRHSKKPSKSAS
ncbi:MAG: hypothetical protein U0524_01945 [Candidatus Saccharimonadales bacterium]